MNKLIFKRRKLSFGEELANTITHGVGVIGILFSIPIISIRAYLDGGVIDVIAVNAMAISLLLMFLSSMMYHLMEFDTKHKEIMRILDHIFIYVAIAGTYTPIAISVIEGWKGILILILQWGAVLFGILFKAIYKSRFPNASLLIYLTMGWAIVLFFPTFLIKSTPYLFWLIVLGGLFYSFGSIFYSLKGIKYSHMIWHIFVFLGALCHFIGIGFYLK
jgi:hemolysin III